MTLRGYDGVASTLQATNKGNVRVGSSDPSYLSVPMPQSSEAGGVGAQYVQASGRSGIAGLQTYKLFLDPPSEDLPLDRARLPRADHRGAGLPAGRVRVERGIAHRDARHAAGNGDRGHRRRR
ncbi:hypothetical protein Q0F99_11620 [Rathayibacter oskolensis]|uniref:hypothetical protein n=1 Tax=Rathayibacter oskolensis TaxID=1891671 RepID=UPI00265F38CD|nr:hypothetical protein [Rathayibacter oskolensis]WKK70508.1 hypothetical protein Q0F99_11620 [Rathayibacter oskolensis]